MGLRLAIKEWAGVIDALGQGHQIILIRKYSPEQNQFLLYPTYNYYNSDKNYPDRFDNKFQSQFRASAREAALRELKETGIVKLRYHFDIDELIDLPRNFPIRVLTPFMIWSDEHVSTYAEKAYGGLCLWIGRARKLAEPIVIARQTTGGSITTYKHFEDFKIQDDDLENSLSQSDYAAKRKQLMQAIKPHTKS